jgi:hypothetical protein
MKPHLRSAAMVYQQILGELHPEYDWVVTVDGERAVDEGAGSSASPETDAAKTVDEMRHPPKRREPAPNEAKKAKALRVSISQQCDEADWRAR